MNAKPYLIGITGGSGSGKTYFLKRLLDNFPKNQVCLISQDNYYKPENLIDKDTNGVVNFDLPEAIDYKQFVTDLQTLRSGQEVHKLEYTFNNPEQKPKILVFSPRPVIIVEGLFVFYLEKIREQIDLKLFIEAKAHIRIKRRIIRDNKERGYDLEDVLYRYEHHVMPAHEKYVEPIKNMADFVIPNNQNPDKALDVIVTFLKKKINDTK